MIEPTVGRAIWYRPPGSHPSAQPHAAHVAFVHDPRLVNLLIISHDGVAYPGTEIIVVQEGDPIPTAEQAPRGYAEWMPYQKGQAAKADALQAQIAGAGQAPAPAPAPQSVSQAAPPPSLPTPATNQAPAPAPQDAPQAASPPPPVAPATQPATPPQDTGAGHELPQQGPPSTT
ncbi:hypothetical protein ACVWW6_006008 [Bradyrhizobium sp. USDA 3311]